MASTKTLKQNLMNTSVLDDCDHVAIVVTNPKGGVGKSTLAQLVVKLIDDRDGGEVAKFVRVDNVRERRDEGTVGARVNLTIDAGARVSVVEADGSAAVSHFDAANDLLLEHDCVLDHGANVQQAWLEAAVRSRLPKQAADANTGFLIMVVTNSTTLSLEGALWTMEFFSKTLARCKVRFALVLNDQNGKGFPDTPLFEAVKAKAEELRADTVEFRNLRGKILWEAEQNRLSVPDALKAAKEIGENLGLGRTAIGRETMDIEEFIEEIERTIAPLLPKKTKMAA